MDVIFFYFFFFSSRRRHTRWNCDWSSDVCSSDLLLGLAQDVQPRGPRHLQVRNHQQVSSRAYLLNCRGAVRRFVHGVTRALQCLAQHGAQLGLVFYEEERFHLFRFYHESCRSHRTTRDTCAEKGSIFCALKAVAHRTAVLVCGMKGFFDYSKLTTANLGSSLLPRPPRVTARFSQLVFEGLQPLAELLQFLLLRIDFRILLVDISTGILLRHSLLRVRIVFDLGFL